MIVSWIIILPLLGALVNGFQYLVIQVRKGSRVSVANSGSIATAAIFGAFVAAVFGFVSLHAQHSGEHSEISETLFHWIRVGEFSLPFTLRLDALSSLFALVITGVGTLIHVYSIGYMAHDEAPAKFFAYLNLFCFAMLCLVLGASLPLLFLGWEGVGLCSYLLIGFWYTDPMKAAAGMKAFIVNRVGDLGVLVGMFILYQTFHTLEFSGLNEAILSALSSGTWNSNLMSLAALALFLGCTGKSAQIPLYVWLPDAMAGPTPVSALIHAATMVTSGVYLIVRLNPLFSSSPDVSLLIALIGGLTAFLAASIAFAQNDIKRVLAYSTVSQLGFMFLACGVGAYAAAVFHVITHAFFKALMFLGSGSVIHGMHEEQDMREMGGLRRHMPITFLTFVMGWLAICGIPPFSGFFSKDEILWKTFQMEAFGKFLWLLGALSALMTAFYMTRLMIMTFFGVYRSKHNPESKVHESPVVMTLPLVVLALLSVLGGMLSIPHMSWLDHWLMGVVGHVEHANDSMEYVLMVVSTIIAVVGILLAKNIVSKRPTQPVFGPTLNRLLSNKWYIDEIYESIIVRPLLKLSKFIWSVLDVLVIDQSIVGIGIFSRTVGQIGRIFHTGLIQFYVLVALLSLGVILGVLIYGV